MTLSAYDQLLAPEPTSSLDVATTGTIDNLVALDVSGNLVSAVRFTAASAVTIDGIVPSVTYGRRLHLMAVGGALTLADNASGSLAANRIRTGTGANVTIAQNGAAWLVYDVTAQVWRLSNGAGGGGSSLPSGMTAGAILYANASNVATWLPAVANGRLMSDASGIPYWFNAGTDPDTIAWDGAWGPAYSVSPWAGRETPKGSTGTTSGGRSATTSASAPTVTSINGYGIPTFNGSNTNLDPASGDLQNYVTTTTGAASGLIVARPSAAVADQTGANMYKNPALIGESAGVWGISYSTAGFFLWFSGSAGYVRSTPVASAVGTGVVVAYRYDGTTLSLSIDYGVTWNDVTSATWTSGQATSRVPHIGQGNTAGAGFFSGPIGDIRMSKTAQTKTFLGSAAKFLGNMYGF